ncbi:MAG: hypothetical protein ABIF09_13040 [Gemmatimonadota bacterium]
MDGPVHEPVLSSLQDPLRAIGSVVLPSPGALDEEGWAEAVRIIEGALVSKPPGIKRQIRLFLRLVNILPVLSTGRTLVGLPVDRRAAFLGRLHRSPLTPLRRGLWGIRTLLFMGYYNQDRIREDIGYGAAPWGWTDHFGGELREAGQPDGPGDGTEKPSREGGEGAS